MAGLNAPTITTVSSSASGIGWFADISLKQRNPIYTLAVALATLIHFP